MNKEFGIIKEVAIYDGIPERLAELIAAQAAHETGNFTSAVFKDNNNAFGYKRYPGSKWQEGEGRLSPEGNNYAKYATLADSVHEITSWIKRRHNEGKFPDLDQITSSYQYAQLLKDCGYYGDTVAHYTAGIDHALELNKGLA